MAIRNCGGAVPMDADVLMIGVIPDRFDHYQRMVKGGFQSCHMGWSYVANLAKSFEYAAREFIPDREDLDIIFITNQVGRTADELTAGATLLCDAIGKMKYELKPHVVLEDKTEFLKPIFEQASIVAECGDIVFIAGERHRLKREFVESRDAA